MAGWFAEGQTCTGREGEWSFKIGIGLKAVNHFLFINRGKKRKEARWNGFADDLAATGRKPSCSYKALHLLLATRS